MVESSPESWLVITCINLEGNSWSLSCTESHLYWLKSHLLTSGHTFFCLESWGYAVHFLFFEYVLRSVVCCKWFEWRLKMKCQGKTTPADGLWKGTFEEKKQKLCLEVLGLGLLCDDKEAPKSASEWNLSETEIKRVGIRIKVSAHITLRPSNHFISSDQLLSTSKLHFLSLHSSVCIS